MALRLRLALARNSLAPVGVIVAEIAPPRQRDGRADDRLEEGGISLGTMAAIIVPTLAGGTLSALDRGWQACRQRGQSHNMAESQPLLPIPLPGPASPDSRPQVGICAIFV
jgi:hypothetical protein